MGSVEHRWVSEIEDKHCGVGGRLHEAGMKLWGWGWALWGKDGTEDECCGGTGCIAVSC